jgi:hypothetical protein
MGREDGRRCLDEDEFVGAGLGLDGHGRWSVIADAARIRARFAEVPESAPLNAQERTDAVRRGVLRVAA